MKRLEDLIEKNLGEFTVHSKAGKDILQKQNDLFDALDQWSEEANKVDKQTRRFDYRLNVNKAKQAIEHALASVYKDTDS